MTIVTEMTERLSAMLLAEVTYEDYAKNQVVIERGSAPSGAIFVRQGLIGIYAFAADGEEVLVAPLVPGVLTGTRLDRDFSFEFSLRALSNVRIGRIPEDRFRRLLEDREFQIWCSRNQERNLVMMTGFMCSAAQRSTDRKILNFVRTYLECVLGRPLGAVEKAEWLITQSHLSDMLGVTRTHLNARLSALAERGVLDIRRRQIYWRRPQGRDSLGSDIGHHLTIS